MAGWLLDDELIQNAYASPSEEQLRHCEQEIGFPIPDEYRRFLIYRNGGGCPDYVSPGESENSISTFFAVHGALEWSGLARVRDGWENCFPDEFLGIADDAFGDYFCIHRDNGKVYFLEHDNPFQDFALLSSEADNLREFLHSLRRQVPEDENPQQLPEFHATREGNREQLCGLLQSHRRVNLKNDEGTFLLHYAIRLWRRGVVSDLLDSGADTESHGPNGQTALFAAGSAQVVDIARLLLNAGANIDAINAEGRSVLMHAIDRGNRRFALDLIAAGADVTYSAPDGSTALSSCTGDRTREYAVPALMAAGATR